MACLQGLQGLVREDEGTNHAQTHTRTHTPKHKPCLPRLISRYWVHFNLPHRDDARCLLDGGEKIVISTPLPRQVCHRQPLIKRPLV